MATTPRSGMSVKAWTSWRPSRRYPSPRHRGANVRVLSRTCASSRRPRFSTRRNWKTFMAIHIVTDSTSCLPTGFAEQHDLPVVPLKVSVDGVFFREFVEISPDVFYAEQKAGAKSGTTQPGPEDFIAVYTRLLANPDDEVLSIHLSAGMSGTLNSAYIAAEQIDPRRVHLYDCLLY